MSAVAPLFLLLLAPCCLAATLNAPPKKCPSLETHPQLQQLRKQCVQFENNATVPQSINSDAERQLLQCVLFRASYSAACGRGVNLAPQAPIQNFTVAKICSDLSWVVESARSLLHDRVACGGACVDWQKGGAVALCNAAFYLDAVARAAVVDSAKTVEQNNTKQVEEVEKPKPKLVSTKSDVDNPQSPADLPLSPVNNNEDVRAEHPPENQQQSVVVDDKKQLLPPPPPPPPQQKQQQQQPPVNSVTSEKAAEKPVETSDAANVKSDEVKPPSNNLPVAGSQQENVVEEQQQQQNNKPPQQEQKQQQQQQKQQLPEQEEQPQQQQPPPQKQEPQQPEQPNNPIALDSPIPNSDTNVANLNNVNNENPEEDIKIEDGNDIDAGDDDDDVDDEGELKYNKSNADEESDKEPAAVPQKPDKTYSSPGVNNQTTVDGDSYFFSYFMMLCIIIVLFYVGYHNKQKIRAIVLEGPRGRRQYRSRRPNSANYHKLDSNLEEAITSPTANKSSSHIIY